MIFLSYSGKLTFLAAKLAPSVGLEFELKVLWTYLPIILVFPTPRVSYSIPDSPKRTTLQDITLESVLLFIYNINNKDKKLNLELFYDNKAL